MIFTTPQERQLYFIHGELKGNFRTQTELQDIFFNNVGNYKEVENALQRLWIREFELKRMKKHLQGKC